MTGLVVGRRSIVVGGWGLRGQRHVRVSRPGSTAKTPARVLVFDEDAGLALLTVDDARFWTGLEPAALAGDSNRAGQVRLLHAVSDGARVDSVAATVMGVGVEGPVDLLHVRVGLVDPKYVASGDVIGSGGQALGVVMMRSSEVWAVSAMALRDFLVEAQQPTYRGFPVLGAYYQPTTSKSLREELGLEDSEGGVRLTRVWANGSAGGALAAGDVVLTLGGKKVDRDGSYDQPGVGRIPFIGAITAGHHPGDVVDVGILRDGKRQSVKMTLRSWPGSKCLVPRYGPVDPAEAYIVEGGLVFENLSGDYLRSYGEDWANRVSPQLLDAWNDRLDSTDDRPHVVVLTRVLADPATLGYQRLRDLVVEQVNGKRVHSLSEVSAAFAHPDGPFHFVTFAPGQAVRRIVLDVQEAKAADGRLKATYMAGGL
jgi:hypothetical protein